MTYEPWTTQLGHLHRWEYRPKDGGDIKATVWFEFDYWHWSVPNAGHPRRGAERVFRNAIAAAEAAAR